MRFEQGIFPHPCPVQRRGNNCEKICGLSGGFYLTLALSKGEGTILKNMRFERRIFPHPCPLQRRGDNCENTRFERRIFLQIIFAIRRKLHGKFNAFLL